jgi:DNA-binding SARP family transcriptional activator
MRVDVLGQLLVKDDGEVVEIGGARLRALLIRLALDAGCMVSVPSPTSALWPDDGPTDPPNALQTLASRLRRALPHGEVLRSAAGGYRLDLPPEAVDALRFERLAREGRQTSRRPRSRRPPSSASTSSGWRQPRTATAFADTLAAWLTSLCSR